MKRFVTTVAMATVSSAMVLGSASIASANSDGGHHGRNGHYGHPSVQSGPGRHHGHGHGAKAVGFAKHSPGFISGNVVQVPIDIPINVCGNTVDVFIAVLNPAFGNICINK